MMSTLCSGCLLFLKLEHQQEPSEQCLEQPAGNDLEGPIPDSMGLLSKLQYLNLANNTLTSSIPQSIWQLQSLGHIILVCFISQLVFHCTAARATPTALTWLLV